MRSSWLGIVLFSAMVSTLQSTSSAFQLQTASGLRHYAQCGAWESKTRHARRARAAAGVRMVQAATAADAWCVSDCVKVPWSTGVASPVSASHRVFAAPPNGAGQPGAALEVEKLAIKWKAGERGNKMAKGGFGWVYFGAYDASDLAGPAHTDVKVVVKMPTDDCDAIAAFEREGLINERIASFGGIQGAAEFLGTLDLSALDASLLPAAVGGRKALVWRQVEGKTLDTYFDRRGGMSPMLAKTLDVRASEVRSHTPSNARSRVRTYGEKGGGGARRGGVAGREREREKRINMDTYNRAPASSLYSAP